MQLMEQNINDLLEQLGGMEKVRTVSTNSNES